MNFLWRSFIVMAMAAGFSAAIIPARANICPTDIQINSSARVGLLLTNQSATISYILNEPATAGATVQIWSGTNVIKTYVGGTNAGLNVLQWDGSTDNPSNTVANGSIYRVSVTAAALGYAGWTNISDDGSNFQVNVPRGIAVNQNSNSPFYGRVFISRANFPFGIYKFNADGSPADEGGFSTGGLDWGSLPHYSPWKMAVSADDYLYVDDFSGDGVLYEFGQTVGSNQFRVAINAGNYPTDDSDPQLSGVTVTGSGTNTQIWMADGNQSDSAGIVVWNAPDHGVPSPNDPGTVAVALDGVCLTQAPYDISVGTNGNIYAIQFSDQDDAGSPVMAYPPFTNQAEMTPTWCLENGDPDLYDAYGISVNRAGDIVAVAIVGTGDPEASPSGGLRLYAAADGTLAKTFDTAAYYDCAWDAVGNLYALDGTAGVWRVYSPPGTNQSTTMGVPVIQAYDALAAPLLVNPQWQMGQLQFQLVGQSNVTYVVERSCDLMQWMPTLTNFSSRRTTRSITLPQTGDARYFRAVALTNGPSLSSSDHVITPPSP